MLRMLLWTFHIVSMFLLRLSIKCTLYYQSLNLIFLNNIKSLCSSVRTGSRIIAVWRIRRWNCRRRAATYIQCERRSSPRSCNSCTVTRTLKRTRSLLHTHRNYTVSQKGPTCKLSVTLSNLNRFSEFLHCWKAYKYRYKTNTTLPTSP